MYINTTYTSKQSLIKTLVLLASFLAMMSAGCNQSNLAYVGGKVLIDGEPAPAGLVVEFQPLDKNGSPSSSFTDKDGNYELRFSKTLKGAQIGESKITVTQPRNEDSPQQAALEFLPLFNKHTPPTYEVKSGRQTYDVVIDTSAIPVAENTGKRKR
ncbi:hypothetical protein FACS1894170_05150 [Planctomycetales bacterium]|nr:hypothetical protein FACS1894170_05150 [Planctomycetales bacterium]